LKRLAPQGSSAFAIAVQPAVPIGSTPTLGSGKAAQMIHHSRILVPTLVLVVACSKELPTIVIDDWWNEDFAREACRSAPVKDDACVQEQVRNVRIFELDLTTQLASLPECGGIKVVRFSNPNEANKAAAEAIGKVHWTLSLNYMPGTSKQQWQMLRSLPNSALMQGEGVPAQIAKSVCTIVNERGAAVGAGA
jgi:hypothetical protein